MSGTKNKSSGAPAGGSARSKLSRRDVLLRGASLGVISGIAWPAHWDETAAASSSSPVLIDPSARLSVASEIDSKVELESSDQRLVDGFKWAKKQALAYVFSGDPVGPWYEAALPGRQAFCMRDVSHQSTGAQVLGLAAFNKNMLRKFALNIASSRDWCSYWEINKDDKPAPVDYRDDRDFWYCLPANFDVLNCCYQQYLWTADPEYISDPIFLNFYDRSVLEYVKRWDKDGDGIPESYKEYGFRGLGTYDEDLDLHPLIGDDLVAAQYAAFVAYSSIQRLRRNDVAAREYQLRAAYLRAIYNSTWWNVDRQEYYNLLLQDWSFIRDPGDWVNLTLWFGMTEEGHKTERAFLSLQANQPFNVEGKSYIPEIAYRYGYNEYAYSTLLELMNPGLKRREYPEVSYSAIRTVAAGLMGISPDAPTRTVQTVANLTQATGWASLKNVPVFQNTISVKQVGSSETTLTNVSGPGLTWKVVFPGHSGPLYVNGLAMQPRDAILPGGRMCSSLTLPVWAKESVTVTVQK